MTAAATVRSDSGALTHRQILTILSGLMLGMFLASLDQTIVSTAIRTIGDDLHGLAAQAWVTTAFLITTTITTPMYGKLSDMYGRKKLYLFAIVIFTLGSALCGLSTSMYMLAGFRAFQGIGAGGLMSLAFAIIGDIIAPRERARYQGYFMAVFATSSVLGPVLGGFFAGAPSVLGITGWRWIFYINVPIAVAAFVVVTKVLQLEHQRQDHRLDYWGGFALIVALLPLLTIAEQGRVWGWGSPAAYLCYAIGAIGLVSFVWIETKMGDEALMPLKLFRTNVFTVGSAQSALIGIAMFGGMMTIPLYLQIVKGASPTKSGLLMIPMMLGLMVSSLSAGQITARTGRYKFLPVIGTAIMVVGMFLLSRISAHSSLAEMDVYMALFGVGLGLSMQPIVLAMQNAVPPQDMGVATAATNFFRQMGGTLGTAVFLSILFSTAGTKIAGEYSKASTTPAFQQAAAAHPEQAQMIGQGTNLNDTNFLHRLPDALAEPFRVGFSDAMSLVFITGAGVLIVAFLFSLRLKEVPLRAVSGLEAARAEALARQAAAAGEGGIAGTDGPGADGRAVEHAAADLSAGPRPARSG